MSVPAAYLSIVLIWSTTPLAIQWSTEGGGFAFAVLARMLIGVVVAGLMLTLWRIGLPLDRRARKLYLVGGLSIFGAMSLTYWAAGRVQSGLISVLFGLSPLLTAAMAALWLNEGALGRRAVAGILLGVLGLAVIFLQGATPGAGDAVAGLLALLLAVVIHSANMVAIKRIGSDNPPLATTVGALAVSLPLFALLWWIGDGQLPESLPPRALAAIAYLGIFGSVIGFALYYYVLKHLDASRVALVTLITPVLALLLGHLLNGEVIEARVGVGSGLILLGLALHQWRSLRAMLLRE